MKTPVYIVEEHNEAFYCWYEFIAKGYIPAEGNYLLHIDHQDAMESGGYAFDARRLPVDMDEVKKITYEYLGTADYIIPAVYQRIFSEVHILNSLLPKPIKGTRQHIRCIDGRVLQCGEVIPYLHVPYAEKEGSEYRLFTLYEGGLDMMQPMQDRSIVLDIDLSYFCWDDSRAANSPKMMEITKEAYREYVDNPYHPFRLLPRKLIGAVEREGRYYLEYHENQVPTGNPTKERMESRVDQLVKWLAQNQIQPKAIDISRSRYSRRLAEDIFPWIEEVLIERLRGYLDIEIICLHE